MNAIETEEQKTERERLEAQALVIFKQGAEQISEMAGDVLRAWCRGDKMPRIFVGEITEGIGASVALAMLSPDHKGVKAIPGVTFSTLIDMSEGGEHGICEITAESGVIPVSRARFKF